MARQALIKFFRGDASGLPTLEDGEPGFTTDTHILYIGESGVNYAIGASATNIDVADAGGDTTCWVMLATSQTGSQQPRSDAGITYNATTNALTATTFVGALTGNASTATALQNARTIGGVSFDGTANIVPQTIESANEATDTTCFLLFITASGTQQLQPKNNTGLTYNSNTNSLGATTFVGALTGNASTATALQTARNINGVAFDGTANITVAAAAGTLTGTTLAANVVTSSLTSVGTLTGGATGAGFTIALTTSTVTGNLPIANLPTFTGLTAADLAVDDEVPFYDVSATANRKVTVERIGGFIDPGICNGRLTLTSGLAITTSDVSSTGTIYFTPYKGSRVSLYDGTRWKLYTLTEKSLSLTLTSGYCYDIFLYDNSGTLTLETAEWDNSTFTVTIASPGVVTWTAHPLSNNDAVILSTTGALPTGLTAGTVYYVVNKATNTFELSATKGGASINTSGSQSGTHTVHSLNTHGTIISLQDGIYVKTGATTRRYLGSIKANGTNTTIDGAAYRGVWNYYNRVCRQLMKTDFTGHTYNSATIRSWNNSTTNRVEFIVGLVEDSLFLNLMHDSQNIANEFPAPGVGLDSTNTNLFDCFFTNTTTVNRLRVGRCFSTYTTPGYHFLQITESVTIGSGNNTFNGYRLDVPLWG